MRFDGTHRETMQALPLSAPAPFPEPRWNLAFLGILFYAIVEYTRLPAMFPVLQPLQLGKVAVGLAALGWLLAPRVAGLNRSGGRGIEITLLLFLTLSLMSALFARYRSAAWVGIEDTLIWLVVYFLISRILITPWRLRIFMLVVLLLNLKLAQHAIRYHFKSLAYWGNEMIVVTQGAGAGSTGYFANAADFGVAMCVAWPIATLLIFSERKRLMQCFLLGTALTFLWAIFVCGSRGAVVGAAGIVLLGWARNPRKIAAVLMVLLLALAVFFVLPEASKQRFRSAWNWQNDKTANTRVKLWKVGLKMFRDHPLLGVGPQNYSRMLATTYVDIEDIEGRLVAHSVYMQTLAELGLGGIVPFGLLSLFFLRLNALTRQRLLAKEGEAARRSFEFCLAQGLDLGLVGYLVSGTFVSVLYYPHLWILLGLSAGLHAASTRKVPKSEADRVRVQERQLAVAVG